METIRSFIAIELSQEIKSALQEIIISCAPKTNIVRWVPVENIHLTLKFLGEIPQARLSLLNKAVQGAVYPLHQFNLTVGKIGAFPSLRRPRVIWVGVQAPVELEILQKEVEAAAARLGFPREERPFSPHLTFGRISQDASPANVAILGDLLVRTHVAEIGTLGVRSVIIFRSDLHPSGPLYTRLYEAKLTGVNEVK